MIHYMEEIANPQIWALTFKILLTKALFSWIYNDHNEFDDVPPFGDVFAKMGEFLETLQKGGGRGVISDQKSSLQIWW